MLALTAQTWCQQAHVNPHPDRDQAPTKALARNRVAHFERNRGGAAGCKRSRRFQFIFPSGMAAVILDGRQPEGVPVGWEKQRLTWSAIAVSSIGSPPLSHELGDVAPRNYARARFPSRVPSTLFGGKLGPGRCSTPSQREGIRGAPLLDECVELSV